MFPLPEGWTAPEIVEDVILADDVRVHRAGLSTVAPDGEEACGSAADPGGPTSERAWFELLERVAGFEAARAPRSSYEARSAAGDLLGARSRVDVFPESASPERWRYARSNGVAIHVGWRAACERAFWELAERDRVLRSWHGELAPERVGLALGVLDGARSYEWRAYSFPEHDRASFSAGIEVVGVFGFPARDDLPFAMGLAGRPDRHSALDAASREALQLLAFLWGEPLPEAPAAGAPGAMQHLDTYQVKGACGVIRGWLESGHARFGAASDDRSTDARRARAEERGKVAFVDLTPSWLPPDLRVVKAVSHEAVPLVFGESPFAAHLPPELRVHPIP